MKNKYLILALAVSIALLFLAGCAAPQEAPEEVKKPVSSPIAEPEPQPEPEADMAEPEAQPEPEPDGLTGRPAHMDRVHETGVQRIPEGFQGT